MKKYYLFFLIIISNILYSAPGDLDTTFGTDGIVENDNITTARQIILDSTGKILVVGGSNSDTQTGVIKYSSTGTLDTEFGTDGITSIANIGTNSRIASNSSNQIFIGGVNSSDEWTLTRLDSDGSNPTNTNSDAAESNNGVLVDGNGNIISAGKNSDNEIIVFKYNSGLTGVDGFGTNGISNTNKISFLNITGIAINSNNDIFITYASDPFNFIVLKVNGSDGTLDTNFGTNGVASINASANTSAIAIDSNNKIILVGRSTAGNTLKGVRLNSDGTLDTDFGTDGIISNNSLFFASSVGIQSTGEIVISGVNTTDPDPAFTLVRYTSAGVLDSSFGTNGLVVNPDEGQINSLTIQSDDKILAAGLQSGLSAELKIARYEGGEGGGGNLTANSSSSNIAKNIPNAVTFTGTDSENTDLLTFAISTQPSNGSLGSITQPSTTGNTQTALVTYTPDTDFTGTDSFAFTITDGSTTSDPATVTLNVNNYGTLSSFVSRLIEKY